MKMTETLDLKAIRERVEKAFYYSEYQLIVNADVPALVDEVERLRADAARYRFLRPHLETDGDVDHPDNATHFWTWLQFAEEHVDLPEAIGWNSVDDAIDAAIDARDGVTR